MTHTLYILCTGNSCRSQMAEGWAKTVLPADRTVKSAGIETHGVNPLAIKAMAEVGIDISDQTSDLIDLETLNNATLVVTLCGDAADQYPMTPPTSVASTGDLTIQQKLQVQMK